MSTKPSGRKASFIWNFYDVHSHEKARCRICHRVYSRKGCCTSGLITHLKKKHTETFLLYLNKGLVRFEVAEKASNNVKKEPIEQSTTTTRSAKRKRSVSDNDEEAEESTSFQNYTDAPSPAEPADVFAEEEDNSSRKKPIEQMCLEEDEYPIINIQRQRGRDSNQFPTNSHRDTTTTTRTTEVESLLTKQLQIQAKLYKEIKEKLEQIHTHIKEGERINRKRYRLKAEKLRILKEEMRRKELHRKEMHRLRLLELDILNKRNVQEQLQYNQL